MNVEDMVLVSVDDHVVEPPDMFDGHLPARYKDLAPYVRQTAAGDDVWFYEDQELPNIGPSLALKIETLVRGSEIATLTEGDETLVAI